MKVIEWFPVIDIETERRAGSVQIRAINENPDSPGRLAGSSEIFIYRIGRIHGNALKRWESY
jgi:hypothetical protein